MNYLHGLFAVGAVLSLFLIPILFMFLTKKIEEKLGLEATVGFCVIFVLFVVFLGGASI